MHLLQSAMRGIEVIDSIDHHIHGIVTGTIIDPDRAKIIAFIIGRFGFPEPHALMTQDIESWGNRIHIRDVDVLGELSDFVRLNQYRNDDRSFIGQEIRTKSGQRIGRCADVQFRTDTFDLEWIFPRRFFRKALPLPISEIVEVTPEAIIIKDQGVKKEVIPAEESAENSITDPVITPAAGMRGDTMSDKTL
ncbi:MAG TPA: hypothetical protein VJB82_01515 [Candidatus Peribacterales bacterium]|nr:hypothetical protein [Candidatus Peribacterales bacterium]